MSLITVKISAAIICFAHLCHPALVGKATPIGTFPIIHRLTQTPGYGGDVLQFKEDAQGVYAIHRVWLLNPSQHRLERLETGNAIERRNITGGCINVLPDVYDQIKSATMVEIQP